MKNIIIILILFIALYSCKKDEHVITTVEGTIINAGTKLPIDSVLVTLEDGIGHSKQTYTSINGAFNITISGEKANLWLEKEGYHFNVLEGGAVQSYKEYIADGENKNEILGMLAEAYFNPVLLGKNSIGNDSVYIDGGDIIPPMQFLKSRNCDYGNGPHKFWEGGKGLFANGDFYYTYWMKYQIHGVWYELIDSVFIKSFTTYTDTIYY